MERASLLSALWARVKRKSNNTSIPLDKRRALPATIFGQPQSFFDSFQIKEILAACSEPKKVASKKTLLELEEADAVRALIIAQIFRKHGHVTASTILEGLQAQNHIPPAPRQKSPRLLPKTAECSICLEDKPTRMIFHDNLSRFCDHDSEPICKACMRDHVAAQLETQNWADLECISCPQPLLPNLVLMYTDLSKGRL